MHAEYFVTLQLTQTGSYSGSPLYTSPEQATLESDSDARSDIYSMGAVAYFLLTGRPPFEGTNPIRVLIAHTRDEVVPPSQLNPTTPLELEKIVIRCLAKNPADRFKNVVELEEAFAKCSCANDWNADRAAEWWRKSCPQKYE